MSVPLSEHWKALAELQSAHAKQLREADQAFTAERDRRMTEVAVEREKALRIKETADLAALQLAREIQTYKDEKANELREQINSERGLYATKQDLVSAVEKVEALVSPISEYVTGQRGKGAGLTAGWGFVTVGGGMIISILLLYLAFQK